MSSKDSESPKEGEKADNTNNIYQLELDEGSSQLMGVINGPQESPVTLHSLAKRIADEGYANFYFPTNSQEQFLRKLQRGVLGRYVLGERRDAKIKITVTTDKSSARVQTSVAWGGIPLSSELIQDEIKKAKLDKRTIDKKSLAQLVNANSEVDLLLAKSIPVTNGEDAHLTSLIEGKIEAQKDISTEEAINQHEVFEFIVVIPGQALMRKTPATAGKDGFDVTGKRIKAKAGKKCNFSKPYSGVEVSPDDENLLIAAIKGHPLVSKSCVKVDPVMVLDAVDLHSGNVDYDGSLVIKNDIESGFSVNVTGDVLVKGAVYKATIGAGGSITVTGGVQADDVDSEHGCHLTAEGDIRAKFINHSNAHSQGNIHVAEYIMQSRVTAKGEVNAGQERGKGCIIGGYCSSDVAVNAKVLGSEAYITTCVSLGSESELYKKVIKLTKMLNRRCGEEQKLNDILETVKSNGLPTKVGKITLDKERKIENTIVMLQQKIEELKGQLNSFRSQVNISDNLHVSVSGRIYPNVQVSINGLSWSCETMRTRVVLKQSDDAVVVAGQS